MITVYIVSHGCAVLCRILYTFDVVKPNVSRLMSLQGVRFDNSTAGLNSAEVVGYSTVTTMKHILRAVLGLCRLRNLPMLGSDSRALRYYVLTILSKKVLLSSGILTCNHPSSNICFIELNRVVHFVSCNSYRGIRLISSY